MSNKEETKKQKIKRKFQGVVVSDKMERTAVVEVSRFKMHPLYKKRYRTRKRYKVHDKRNEARVGDKVIFEECRPLSREKRWRLVEILRDKT